MAPTTKDTQQITLRLERAQLARATEAAVRLTVPGLVVTQTDALRRAIAIGLEAILESSDALMNEGRDPWIDVIETWLQERLSPAEATSVTTQSLLADALQLAPMDITRAHVVRVDTIMAALGWKPRRVLGDGKREWTKGK